MESELNKVAQERELAVAQVEAIVQKLRALVVAGHRQGMSEWALADAAGVTRRTVRRWIGKE